MQHKALHIHLMIAQYLCQRRGQTVTFLVHAAPLLDHVIFQDYLAVLYSVAVQANHRVLHACTDSASQSVSPPFHHISWL